MMLLSLRRHHRHIFIALRVLLPVAFAVGVVARKSVPTMNELPVALVAAPQKFEAVEWERADLFAKSPIGVRLLREQKDAGRFAISFSAVKDFVKSDLIVYWVAGNPNITAPLPDNAILLGGFGMTALLLPDEVVKSDGSLILYSLADNEIVDVSKPILFIDSIK